MVTSDGLTDGDRRCIRTQTRGKITLQSVKPKTGSNVRHNRDNNMIKGVKNKIVDDEGFTLVQRHRNTPVTHDQRERKEAGERQVRARQVSHSREQWRRPVGVRGNRSVNDGQCCCVLMDSVVVS